MTAFTPTDEQAEALRLFATGKSLAIEAGAGTGKTATLKLLGESTSRRGQYIAFNKAIVEEAKLKMPSTVAAATAHSLAYRNTVARNPWMAERLRHSARMKSTEIASRLKIDQIDITLQDGSFRRLHSSYLAGLTMRAVIRFCQTADLEPDASLPSRGMDALAIRDEGQVVLLICEVKTSDDGASPPGVVGSGGSSLHSQVRAFVADPDRVLVELNWAFKHSQPGDEALVARAILLKTRDALPLEAVPVLVRPRGRHRDTDCGIFEDDPGSVSPATVHFCAIRLDHEIDVLANAVYELARGSG